MVIGKNTLNICILSIALPLCGQMQCFGMMRQECVRCMVEYVHQHFKIWSLHSLTDQFCHAMDTFKIIMIKS